MRNLVCTDWVWRIGSGGVSIIIFLIVFPTVVSHIGGRDDFLPSLPFFLCHSFNQYVSRLYGTVVKWLLEYIRLYASYILFDLSVRPGTYSV